MAVVWKIDRFNQKLVQLVWLILIIIVQYGQATVLPIFIIILSILDEIQHKKEENWCKNGRMVS